MGKLVTKKFSSSTTISYSSGRADRASRACNNEQVNISKGIIGFKDHAILTEPEIRALIRLFQTTGNIDARNRVIEYNLKLIWLMVSTFVSPRSQEFTNVYDAAIVEVANAVEHFDLAQAEAKDTKFMSYATWWVRKAVSYYFSRVAPMLRLPIGIIRSIRAEQIAYLERTNPGSKELTRLRKRQRGKNTYDIACMTQASELNEESILYSEDDAEDDTYPSGTTTLAACDRNTIVESMLNVLPPRERFIIERSFALGGSCTEPMTIQAIADSMTPPISKERVRQLRNQGYERIRKHLHERCIALHDII